QFGWTVTGGAWLSSARVVRCWVKSRNERNPCRMLPASYVGDSCETAGDKPEEGGDDVKSSCPLCPGLHTCYIGRYKGLRYREVGLDHLLSRETFPVPPAIQLAWRS